jgi:hypothetical protein
MDVSEVRVSSAQKKKNSVRTPAVNEMRLQVNQCALGVMVAYLLAEINIESHGAAIDSVCNAVDSFIKCVAKT